MTDACQAGAGPLDAGKNAARGIAALFVCIDHAYGLFLEPHFGDTAVASHFVALAAHQAVMVFFAISGFLITRSILANLDRNAGFSLRDYLYARIARVYPPLVFSVLLTCLLYLIVQALGLAGSSAEAPYRIGSFPLMREVFALSGRDALRALAMVNGLLLANGPLWSLCIEWWIYVVVGLTVFVFSVRGLLCKAAWGGVLVLAATRLHGVNTHALFYLGIWLFGGALALARQRAGGWPARPWGLIGGLFAVIMLVSALAPDLVLAGGRLFGWGENAVQFVICAFWCALILPDQRSGTTMAWGALFHLGECSFSLYILHFPLMLFFLSVMQSALGTALPVALGGAVAGGGGVADGGPPVGPPVRGQEAFPRLAAGGRCQPGAAARPRSPWIIINKLTCGERQPCMHVASSPTR
ncbi:acyltransferase family protein [Oryzomicrobium sp.]|uniref:acyltransferase family protein n=1 Tax=Oryzomicrobium sp. TaxID=1911578 RepID=UPI002FE0BD3E